MANFLIHFSIYFYPLQGVKLDLPRLRGKYFLDYEKGHEMFIRSPKELALMVISQRKKYKFTQGEVGRLVGVKQQTISDFENKPESTKINTLFKIIAAVNLELRLEDKNADIKKLTEWNEEW